MRRLEKPVWMLNYNGEPHGLRKKENKLDFAKRMQQFFDHYLMDAEATRWISVGVPAVDKGKEFGFEPVEPEEAAETEEAAEAEEAAEPESEEPEEVEESEVGAVSVESEAPKKAG